MYRYSAKTFVERDWFFVMNNDVEGFEITVDNVHMIKECGLPMVLSIKFMVTTFLDAYKVFRQYFSESIEVVI